MNNKTEVFYRYSNLDKQGQFQIVSSDDSENYKLWIWFYLGKYLHLSKKKYSIYPYYFSYDYDGDTKTKLLKIYEHKYKSADQVAKLVANLIKKKTKDERYKNT